MMSTAITFPIRSGHHHAQSLAETLADYVPFTVLDSGGECASDFTRVVPLDDVIYADLSWSRRELVRRANARVPANGEYYALATVRSGEGSVAIGGETYRVTTGDLVLWNCQAPTLISIPSLLRKSGLLIPVPILDHLSLAHPGGKGLTYLTAEPTAPLLRRLLCSIGDLSRPSSPVDRRTRNALLELAFGTIESAQVSASPSLLPALRDAVCRWIDDHIFDSDLNPRTVAGAHSVSVRTLHRAFQSQQRTLSEMISVRKLEKARDLLWDGRTVTYVSAMLNFANPSHFSRAFTGQYAITPSEYKTRARESMHNQVALNSD